MKNFIFSLFFLLSLLLCSAILSSHTFLIPLAHADLPPSPDDPCYKKNKGDKCKTRRNEAGICTESCDDRIGPDGEVMYSRCSLYCAISLQNNTKNEEQPKKNN